MKRARLFTVIAIIGAAAASLTGAVPASATARPSSLPAARVMPVAQAGRVLAAPLPAGARPARPPQPGTGLPGRLRAAAPADTVGCYDQQSIESAENLDWVSAELGYTGANYAMLRARATTIGPWEEFDLCYDYTNAFWYIVSDANGNYVSTELGYTGDNYAMLRARATAIGPWEKFTLGCYVLPVGPQYVFLVILSKANNSYVAAELGYTGANYAMLRARATAIDPEEEYVNSAVCPQ